MLEYDITIIINVHNRHYNLDRILDYYSSSNIKLIISDSSSTKYKFKSHQENIEYLYFKDYEYSNKLFLTLKKVITKYVVICADDDFISLEGILKSLSFLEQNPSYTSAHGHYFAFSYIDNTIQFRNDYPKLKEKNINQAYPLSRLESMFKGYIQLLYAVHKTNILLSVFNVTKQHIINHNLVELLVAFISLIKGKSYYLPIFYAARERSPGSAGTYMKGLEHYYKAVNWDAEFIMFNNIILEGFDHVNSISQEKMLKINWEIYIRPT